MSKDRVTKERGWVNPKKLPKGPNGRALCRECKTEVPPNRKTFCSRECVAAWRIKSDPTYVRQQAFARDHGVCAICGLDTQQLERVLLAYYAESGKEAALKLAASVGFKVRFYAARYGRIKIRSLHEIDHIVPVAEGGGLCSLDQMRTLCTRCHKKVTAELMARLAKKRLD